MRGLTRRRFLAVTGAATTGTLAGCGNESAGEVGKVDGSGFVGVDRWLDTDEFGSPTSNYDGMLVDYRDVAGETPPIKVGAEGNGGHLAFDPPAIIISQGDSIRWEWTGKGGAHNVVSNPNAQMEISSKHFRSGDPVVDREIYSQAAGSVGSAFYQCENHLGDGMKGVVLWR